MTPKSPATVKVDALRRLAVGVMAGLVPALFVGWLMTTPEGSMGLVARAVGLGQRVMLLALASAVVGVAGLFGLRLLRLARVAVASVFARFVLGAGLGLGVIALATLGAGLGGFLSAPFAAILLGAMFLVGVVELHAVGEFVRRPSPRFARLSWLELALVAAGLFVLVLELLVAFNLPTDYDACEYHMAAPWRWAQLGRIDWVEGNVYTNLPMNAEMLYLFSMELVGSPGGDAHNWFMDALRKVFGVKFAAGGGAGDWDRLCLGVHLGVVMNLVTALLATAAVYVLARKLFSRRAALAAAVLFFTMPWIMVSSTINIHNELLLAAWATLAVYALIEFAETRLVKWAVVAAVFAGLAAGVKYTALGFFVPVGAAAMFVCSLAPCGRGLRAPLWGARSGEEGPPHEGAADPRAQGPKLPSPSARVLRGLALALLYALVVVLVLGPWLAKNWALAENPVFPFGYKWFGGRDWSPELDWKWYAGNYKAANTAGAGILPVAVWNRVIMARWGSLGIAAFALLALVKWRDRRVVWLWALVILWTLLWYFGTHRVDRFWMPFAGIAAVLAGCGFDALSSRPARAASTAALALALGWHVFVNSMLFAGNVAGNYDIVRENHRLLASRYDLTPIINTLPGRGETSFGPWLFIGEARTLYMMMEAPGDVRCSTVFNRDDFARLFREEPDAKKIREALHRAGIRDVFVNWVEIGRLRESYSHRSPEGRIASGFRSLTPADFQRLEATGVLARVHFPDVSLADGYLVHAFPEVTAPLRGLTSEEMAALRGGRVCACYRVRE